MNYYERYVGDFQRDTGHLSCAEIGVYDRLLDHYYGTEEPLPSNHADLCRIARAMDKIEQKAVKRVADEFFHIGDDGLLHNSRADVEVAKAQARINAAKENGKKGGRPPNFKANDNQTQTQQKPIGFQSANPAETHPGVHHTPHASISIFDQPVEVNTSPPAKPAATAGRGTRLPTDWQLPKLWGEWALAERQGWTTDDVRRCAEKFRDHWVSATGRGATKADWLATWRNWVRNENRPPTSAVRGFDARSEDRKRAIAELTGENHEQRAEREINPAIRLAFNVG